MAVRIMDGYLNLNFSASEALMTKMLNILYHVPLIFRFSNLYKIQQTHVLNGIFKIADEVYEAKLDKQNQDSVNESFENNESKNFISHLMDPKHELSIEEIKDEINTLIAAVR